MSNAPRFSHKETRQLAKEAEEAGFVYVGDDTKGHAEFEHPEGVRLSLSETPAHGQIQRVRRIIAKAIGQSRSGYDPEKRRAKQSAERDKARAETIARQAAQEQVIRDRNGRIDRANLERRVIRRYDELRSIESLMGCRRAL